MDSVLKKNNKQNKKLRLIKYIAVGLSSYALELITLWACFDLFGLSRIISVSISFWVGFCVAFILQKIFTFNNFDKTKSGLSKQIILYSFLVGWNYLFTVLFVFATKDLLNIYVARGLSMAVIVCWNYLAYGNLIFNKTKKTKTKMSLRKKVFYKDNILKSYNIVQFKSNNSIKIVPFISLVVLFLLIGYFGYYSGRLLLNNADQIADILLFANKNILSGALFSSAHSFFIKWPIFYLISLVSDIKIGLVVSSTLINLLVFTFIIALVRIIIGNWPKTILVTLAVASTYILIPLEPHLGALLPVNFAMLTTRNIEYVVFIISIIFITKASSKLKSFYYISAVFISSLLITSDKLFMSWYLGGAMIYGAYYLIRKNKQKVYSAIFWLLNSFLAFWLSILTIFLINLTKVTSIGGIAGQSPYNLTTNITVFAKAVFYAVFNTFSLFGANPMTIPLRSYITNPRQLISFVTFMNLVNLILMIIGLVYLFKAIKSPTKNKEESFWKDILMRFVAICLTAYLIFVATDHYYPVDARYLSIIYFTVIVAVALQVRKYKLTKKAYKIIYPILVIVVIGSSIATYISLSKTALYYQNKQQQNQQIESMLKSNNVKYLIGDYWRLLPIKAQNNINLNIVPVVDCNQPQQILASSNWYKPINSNQPVAYLATKKSSDGTYNGCSLNDVVNYYGQPTKTLIIDGNQADSKEVLLIYGNGVNSLVAGVKNDKTSKKIQTLSEKFDSVKCINGTSLNIVAHQDDDLLFMNPDILDDFSKQKCVVTVYITAGKGYDSDAYWIYRENGSRQAYSKMMQTDAPWNNDIFRQRGSEVNSYVNKNSRLIFLRLPDGGRLGHGFEFQSGQSLAKLWNNEIGNIYSVDNSLMLNKDALVRLLADIIIDSHADTIRVQSSLVNGDSLDHSDHSAGSNFSKEAINNTKNPSRVAKQYLGYNIRLLPANLNAEQSMQKAEIFLTYATYDGAVCQNINWCNNDKDFYGSFLNRQYWYVIE